VAHPHALQAHESSSGDESDRKSFTEDEGEGVLDIDEAEGEAERLILRVGQFSQTKFVSKYPIVWHKSYFSYSAHSVKNISDNKSFIMRMTNTR
jgi:hypothetical protein